MLRKQFVFMAAVAVVLGGCVHQRESYREGRGAQPPQPQSVSYSLPAENPRGAVYVMSIGVEPLQIAADQTAPYLHMRLAANNQNDDVVWRFDPNEQIVQFDGGAPVDPSFAEASAGGPVLTLQAGQRGHLDLYYPLPGQQGTPRTTFQWRVHRGQQVVANSTVFEPVRRADRTYAYYEPLYSPRVGVHLRFGPAWWWGYDPFYWSYYRPWGPFDWGPSYYYPYYARPYPRYLGPRYSRPAPVPAPPVGRGWRAQPSPAPRQPATPAPPSGGREKSEWRYRR